MRLFGFVTISLLLNGFVSAAPMPVNDAPQQPLDLNAARARLAELGRQRDKSLQEFIAPRTEVRVQETWTERAKNFFEAEKAGEEMMTLMEALGARAGIAIEDNTAPSQVQPLEDPNDLPDLDEDERFQIQESLETARKSLEKTRKLTLTNDQVKVSTTKKNSRGEDYTEVVKQNIDYDAVKNDLEEALEKMVITQKLLLLRGKGRDRGPDYDSLLRLDTYWTAMVRSALRYHLQTDSEDLHDLDMLSAQVDRWILEFEADIRLLGRRQGSTLREWVEKVEKEANDYGEQVEAKGIVPGKEDLNKIANSQKTSIFNPDDYESAGVIRKLIITLKGWFGRERDQNEISNPARDLISFLEKAAEKKDQMQFKIPFNLARPQREVD